MVGSGMRIFLLAIFTTSAEIGDPDDSSCSKARDEECHDEVSLVQLSQPVIRQQQDEKLWQLGNDQELMDLDERPLENYNFGVTWNEWYDDMVHRFPPSKTGYDTTNYGLATESLHYCAAGVPAGEIGHSWAFNHTAGTNMYATLVSRSPVILSHRNVLEVSSGRGGGAALISDCFCPSQMVGIDLSHRSVASSQARYGRNGSCPISFMQGDAMELQFANESFEAVVNVEASHTYPSYRKFVREVWRVLRPGGVFLTADFRTTHDADVDVKIMQSIFSKVVSPIDISDLVMRSFDQNQLIDPFRQACNEQYLHSPQSLSWKSLNYSLHCDHFAGTGYLLPALRHRTWNYRMYILQK